MSGASQAGKSTEKAGGSKEPVANVPEPDDGAMPVSLLEGDGISERDIQSLKSAGLITVTAVAFCPKKTLTAIRGITDIKADKLMGACHKILNMGFSTATEVLKQRAEIIYITTGSKKLDEILGGGIETGSITELYGEAKAGKTQLCLQLAVMCQLPVDMQGGEGKCVYVSTVHDLRTERLISIAEHYKLNTKEVLDNISQCKAMNTDHQEMTLTMAAALMMENRYAILIIDSATHLFRTDYSGRGELSERQIKLGQFLRKLAKMAHEFGVAVLITNEVVADMSSSSLFNPNPIKPIGGDTLGHAAKTRLFLRKGRGETRICTVVNSPVLPTRDAPFAITGNGIEDVVE